jgi:hypothetical protein
LVPLLDDNHFKIRLGSCDPITHRRSTAVRRAIVNNNQPSRNYRLSGDGSKRIKNRCRAVEQWNNDSNIGIAHETTSQCGTANQANRVLKSQTVQ